MTARVRLLVTICSIGLACALTTGVPSAFAAGQDGGARRLVSGTVVALDVRIVPGSGAVVTDVRLSDTSGAGAAVPVTFTMSGGEVGGIGMWSEVFTDLSAGDFATAYVADKDGGTVAVTAPVTVAKTLGFSISGLSSAVESALSGYGWDGLHWDGGSLPVGYYVNASGLPAGAAAAIQAAAQTWENDPGSAMDFTYLGATGRSSTAQDGFNVVGAGATSDPTALADCAYWYNPMTDHIFEFDITFNVSTYGFATDGGSSTYDLQTVGTHELGHTLSLADLYDAGDSAQVMYGYCSKGNTGKRALASGDIAGIRAIYPIVVATSTLSGTVTSSAGGPLADVSVAVDGAASGVTDASGAYSIPGIPAGNYNVTYTRSGYSTQSKAVDLATSKTVSVSLAPVVTTVTLSGTVTSSDGNPLAGVSVAVGGVASGVTGAGGSYSIAGIPARSYSVTYTRSGYASQTFTVDLSASRSKSVVLAPVDATPPVTTSDVTTSYVGFATIHLAAADNEGGSGVAHTYYRLDAGGQAEGTSLDVSVCGTHTIEFWSVDARGNVEVPVSATFVVSASDVTPPPVVVPIATRVTITSNRTSVTRRHPVSFSGTISSTQRQGTHVVVWAKRPGSNHWDKLSVRYTTSGHRWYYTYAPAARGTWYFRVRFAATTVYAASVSSSRRITVR